MIPVLLQLITAVDDAENDVDETRRSFYPSYISPS